MRFASQSYPRRRVSRPHYSDELSGMVQNWFTNRNAFFPAFVRCRGDRPVAPTARTRTTVLESVKHFFRENEPSQLSICHFSQHGYAPPTTEPFQARQLPKNRITNWGYGDRQIFRILLRTTKLSPLRGSETRCVPVQVYKDATPPGLRRQVEICQRSETPEGWQLCSKDDLCYSVNPGGVASL